MPRELSEKENEKIVFDQGIQVGNIWLNRAFKGDAETVTRNVEMLKSACIHTLATYCYSKSKPECFEEPTPIINSIMDIKDKIEDHVNTISKNHVENDGTVQFMKTKGGKSEQ